MWVHPFALREVEPHCNRHSQKFKEVVSRPLVVQRGRSGDPESPGSARDEPPSHSIRATVADCNLSWVTDRELVERDALSGLLEEAFPQLQVVGFFE